MKELNRRQVVRGNGDIVAGTAVPDMIKQDFAAAVHFEVEITFGVGGLDEEFDTTVTADLILIFFRHSLDILILHLKKPVDITVVIQHLDPRIRMVRTASVKNVVQFQFNCIAPCRRIPRSVQFDRDCRFFYQVTHFEKSFADYCCCSVTVLKIAYFQAKSSLFQEKSGKTLSFPRDSV